MFSREYVSTLLILVEFLEKGHETCKILGNPTSRYWYPNRGGTSTTKQNQSGTGTKIKWYRYQHAEPKWYRYQDKVVPVPTCRTGLVSIPIKVVPVPLLPIAAIFGILTLLSSNLHTEGIGPLIND